MDLTSRRPRQIRTLPAVLCAWSALGWGCSTGIDGGTSPDPSVSGTSGAGPILDRDPSMSAPGLPAPGAGFGDLDTGSLPPAPSGSGCTTTLSGITRDPAGQLPL